jgi:hypothetical protein
MLPGCFYIGINKNSTCKNGFNIRLSFLINLHEKDKAILQAIQTYFNVGKIYRHGNKSFQYTVRSIEELKVILDHFDKYPLITQKRADYILFKKGF